jgi:phosphoglycerate dehydrogenase-like enzyme
MAVDVVCLRPEKDFTSIGVTPPPALSITYIAPADPDLPALLKDARALILPAVGPALPGDLFRGTALRLVQVTGAGLDRLDRKVLAEEGIPLANVPGGSNAALAEYCVATSLALLRGFAASTAPLRAGRYAAHRQAMVAAVHRGLGGLTVGLVGLGTIGLAVATAFRAMGASIVYHDPAPPRDPAALDRLGARAIDLDALLAEADVVSLHVPLMETTRNLLDADRLARMKPGAILINAARGGIVDEAALAAALESGHLGGAAVDVYSTEPPAPDNPLLGVSDAAAARLILTPHIAGVSLQASQHLFREAWDNVVRVVVDGRPALYVVA